MKEKWTKNKISDLTGEIIIVTGGNTGLGFESVKAFTEKGAEVILACRDIKKGENAKASILSYNSSAKIHVEELDLMNLDSIRNFADRINKNYNRLDVLLNNAGIMTTPYFLTKDGFEAQMGTNHLGHFALTGLLLNLIKITPQSRVVNVSSLAHKSGNMKFDNILYDNGKDYTPMSAYGRSKLSNLLFTYELNRLFNTENIDAVSVAAHPGASQTELGRHIEGKLWFKLLKPLISLMTQSAEIGALPQIRAATDLQVEGGEFFGPGGFNEMKGYPVIVNSNEASHNEKDARMLWEVSEKLTRVSYSFKKDK